MLFLGLQPSKAVAECGDYVIFAGTSTLMEHGSAGSLGSHSDGVPANADSAVDQSRFHRERDSGSDPLPCHGPTCGQGKPNWSIPPASPPTRRERDPGNGLEAWCDGADEPTANRFARPQDQADVTAGFPQSIERPPRSS
ncbi:MAG: hypothetical protein R3B96_19805 [Pirellulaceae bacterium]